jgi:uncharacterized protein YecE (DUF72 family)
MPASYFIGTSGWHYDHWRDIFYPRDLSKDKWLGFYAAHFTTVELNNSFYRLPSEDAFANWYRSSPADFTFATKVSRYITHVKRLRDTGDAVDRFVSRAAILKEKLGPLLYQLPPNMRRNEDALAAFLATLPGRMKHVFEFRHESWFDQKVFDTLRRYNAGFCIYDMPSVSCPVVVTVDFAYIRFHGSTGLYSSNYSDKELADWAAKLADLGRKLTAIYIYFNNDAGAFAIKNAITLRGYLEKQ